MTDPTLATVDDEPWNQSPADQRRKALANRRAAFVYKTPETVPIESALSIADRINRRIPIMTPTGHAEYVYSRHGTTTMPECCWACEAKCILSLWTACMKAPRNQSAVSKVVEGRLEWVRRCEIADAIRRLFKTNRITTIEKGRTFPLYTLPPVS